MANMSNKPDTRITLRPNSKDGPQHILVTGKRLSAKAKAAFLDHLAASCNVSWAAAQAGFTSKTFYNLRRKDAGFARSWEEALDDGRTRLRTELIGTAIDYVERLRSDAELPLKHMTVREAISLINRHGDANGATRRFRPRERSLEEVRESILNKLEAIEALRLAEAAEKDAEPGDGAA
jgi:hypothetical protein